MTIKEDLLRAAAYIGATNDSPSEESSIDSEEGDRIAGVLRELAATPGVTACGTAAPKTSSSAGYGAVNERQTGTPIAGVPPTDGGQQ